MIEEATFWEASGENLTKWPHEVMLFIRNESLNFLLDLQIELNVSRKAWAVLVKCGW